MKKFRVNYPRNPRRFLRILAVLLCIGFCVRLGCDYWLDYLRHPEYSAPFWVWALLRGADFLLPAGLCAVAAAVLKRKNPAVPDAPENPDL